jgi:hypothetical protein
MKMKLSSSSRIYKPSMKMMTWKQSKMMIQTKRKCRESSESPRIMMMRKRKVRMMK